MLQFMGLQRVGHDWATELNCVMMMMIYFAKLALFMCWWISAKCHLRVLGTSHSETISELVTCQDGGDLQFEFLWFLSNSGSLLILASYLFEISLVCSCCCCCLVYVSCNSLWPPWTDPTRQLCPWDYPGKNTRVDCHFLLQGIFLVQGSNPCLLVGGWIIFSTLPLWKSK